jgi:5-carboxymethyl-2-hydroxymuconate isomerase
MPHFIIHCSETILNEQLVDEMMSLVHDTADATGLFKKGDIKVRVLPFHYYTTGNIRSDFIHVFGYIMEGRTAEQKSLLSRAVISKLKILFPQVPVLSINISEFEKATYCNRTMI